MVTDQYNFASFEDDSFSGELYFPTLVFNIICADHEALNEYLLNLINAERERDQKGIERSNFRKLGGWHSHNNLHRETDYKPITDRVNQAGRRISRQLGYHPEKHLKIGTMWSIINAPGSSNKAHVHPGCHWSGVYYVQTPKNAGDIEFTDPRTPHVMNQPSFAPKKQRSKENWTKVRFTPKAGKMLIFPSWLYHSVDPNMSDQKDKNGERVIISFNLTQTG
ncbi:hypothetical protein GN278_11050 [Rhodobacteraceae bacterium Araon29]